MRIGSSIALIAIGAILAFAVQGVVIDFIDLTMVGYILLVLGVLGLIISLILAATGADKRVSHSRSTVDPRTGERITRNERRDSGF